MTRRGFVHDVLAGACIAFILLLLFGPYLAHADDDHHRGGDDLDVATELTASMVGGENRSLALSGGSLGDVDINGCLGSTQFSVFVLFAKQGLKIDALCVADKYDLVGRHQLAAQLRCKVPLIADLDYSGTNCIEANTFTAPPPPPPPDTSMADQDDDDDELLRDTAAALADLQAQLNRERSARRAYATQQAVEVEEQAQAERDFNAEFLEQFKQVTGNE